jgi:hypothetical protein
MHGLKKASRLNNGLIPNIRMSHRLQMDISRRGYDLQMPIEAAAASDTASASKKCPWAAIALWKLRFQNNVRGQKYQFILP